MSLYSISYCELKWTCIDLNNRAKYVTKVINVNMENVSISEILKILFLYSLVNSLFIVIIKHKHNTFKLILI